MTGGDGGSERERAGGGGERPRQLWSTGQRERERSERAGWRRQAGLACQTQRARAQARLNGPT
jgi:hypothetical protein